MPPIIGNNNYHNKIELSIYYRDRKRTTNAFHGIYQGEENTKYFTLSIYSKYVRSDVDDDNDINDDVDDALKHQTMSISHRIHHIVGTIVRIDSR